MPYIGNVLTSFAVETGNINDQAVTAPKLSATGGTDGQILALDSNLNLEWVSDPAGQWVTNGSNIHYNDGNVGIGTASPGEPLHISASDPAIKLEDSDGTDQYSIIKNAAGNSIYDAVNGSGTAGAHIFRAPEGSSNERMRIDSSGNVGIGESSPDLRFHVKETIDVAYSADNATSDANNLLKLENPSTTANAFAGMAFRTGNGADLYFGSIQQSANEGDFYFANQNSTNKELMRIKSTGNVGIGTSSPSQNLHVSAASGTRIQVSHTGGSVDALLGTDSGNAFIGTSTNHDFRFLTNNGERLRIDSSGRLLVGTSSDVTGSTHHVVQAVTTGGGRITLARNDTSVTAGDVLGQIGFSGNDANGSYQQVANITCEADGTHGDDDKPGRLRFLVTASGAGSATERMRISNTGNIKLTGGEALFWDDAGDRYIACIGDTSSNINLHGRANVIFKTGGSSYDGGTERMRIDSNGILLVGRSAARTNWNDSSIEPKVFIEGAGDNDSTALCVVSNSGSTSGASRGALLTLARTKGTAVGSNTAVDENTALGIIEFKGNDGTSFTTAAKILAACDGTPGTDDMPGRLVFSTSADGSGVPTERMRIDSSGNIGINQSTPTSQSGKVLHISGDDGGQARIHLSTSASGHGANEGSYIIAQGAESGASAGQLSIQNLENRDIIFGTGASGATEKLRIQNAGGISFNGDTAAANALNDYEEGDWTPTFGIGSVTTTDEVYAKIGRLVTLTARVTIPSTTNTATVNIGGLPFTPDGFMNSAMGGIVGETTLTSTDRPVACVESSSNVIRFRQNGATSLTFANLSQITLRFMVTYFTDQ